MRSFLLATSLCFAIATGAAAQTADKKATPGDAPTKSMDAATPEMKGPGAGEHPPTGRMDQAVPSMKAGESASEASSAAKLSQSECDALWTQANPSGAATLTESQALPYVSDFKAANPDGDETLDQNEFSKACDQGLVKSAASGASPAGTTDASKGATKEGQATSDRTPDTEAMTPETQVDTPKEGGTSDRTPAK